MFWATFFASLFGYIVGLGFGEITEPKSPLAFHSPCHEDEVLYPVTNGMFAYPEGKLTCVNIEEFWR